MAAQRAQQAHEAEKAQQAHEAEKAQKARKAGKTRPKDKGHRIVIEGMKPEVDHGRAAIKRTVGAQVVVEADLVCDGHDQLAGVLRHRHADQAKWKEAPLEPLVNDRWRASFSVTELGCYEYTLQAWVDPFATWRHGLEKKVEVGQNVEVDLQIGAILVRQTAARARGKAKEELVAFADALRDGGDEPGPKPGESRGAEPGADAIQSRLARARIAADPALCRLMAACCDRQGGSRYSRQLKVMVDRTEDWEALWDELKSVFEFWIDQGVRIFRVDNPHTKPFAFWDWVMLNPHELPAQIFLANL